MARGIFLRAKPSIILAAKYMYSHYHISHAIAFLDVIYLQKFEIGTSEIRTI